MSTVQAPVIDGEVTVDRARAIAGQARAVDLGRVGRRLVAAVVWLLVGVLWLIGWAPAQLANAVAFLVIAIRTGWRDARPVPVRAAAPVREPDRTVR